MAARLLDFACANEALFAPTRVGVGEGKAVRPEVRISSVLRDFAPLKDMFRQHVRPLAPELTAALRTTPFELSRVELELVAHGDGAFYKRHIDTLRQEGSERLANQRIVSAVYYFHAQPKAFDGGALRLHEVMPRGADAQFVDIQPVHNSFVYFPSWMPHEVTPVRCPSGRFADSRFAINCWFHRAVA